MREVDAATLLQYADDPETLSRFTAKNGAQIPADFWDVRTPLMVEEGVDEYIIVRGAAMPESAPYICLLAQACERFLTFKEQEAAGQDTALDAAPDILKLAAMMSSTMTSSWTLPRPATPSAARSPST